MVSSKDIAKAKKLYAGLRRFNRKFLDHLYAEAEGRGLFPLPLPHEAVAELYGALRAGMWPHKAAKAVTERTRIVKAVLEGKAPGVCTDVTDLQAIADRFYQLAYHDALDAYLQHRPDLNIKAKLGRKPEIELAERIWKLKAEGKTVPEMQAIFKAEGQHFSQEKIASYLKTRRKKLPRQ